MRERSRIQGAACRVFRGWLVLSLLAASFACAGRRLPQSGPIQAVELTPEERLGVDDVFEVRSQTSGAGRISMWLESRPTPSVWME